MVHFVGAGPGATDLITVRGMNLIREADVIIYAGSLVNPGLLTYAPDGAEIYDSSHMTLEEVINMMKEAEAAGRNIVRLHTGDQSIYGAVKEQMRELDSLGIEYDSCPGVSAAFGAAADMDLEYTLPGISQTLIITRMEGRTPVPADEGIEKLAAHKASMAVYLSTGMADKLSKRLVEGGYDPDTPAAVVYKATWPEEKIIRCTVGTIADECAAAAISKTAVILIGDVIAEDAFDRSRLYDPEFTTEFRKGISQE